MTTLTFAGMDMFINAVTQSGPFQPTFLYARFGDSGSNPGDLAPADEDLRNTVRADFVVSSDNLRGGLWVPVLGSPIKESTNSTRYLGNKVSWQFRIPYNIPAAQISPADNFTAGSSYIYALGLAVATAGSDRSQDRIVAVMDGFTPYPVPPSGQIAVDFPIELYL